MMNDPNPTDPAASEAPSAPAADPATSSAAPADPAAEATTQPAAPAPVPDATPETPAPAAAPAAEGLAVGDLVRHAWEDPTGDHEAYGLVVTVHHDQDAPDRVEVLWFRGKSGPILASDLEVVEHD